MGETSAGKLAPVDVNGQGAASGAGQAGAQRLAIMLLASLPLLGGAGVFIVGGAAVALISPVLVAWLRFTGAAVVLVLLHVLGGARWSLRRRDLPAVVGMALMGTVAYNLTLLYGLRLAPATDAGLLTLAEAPIQMLLARALLGERLQPRAWRGLVLSSVGLVMVIGLAGGTASPARLAGDLLLLGSAACWPLYAVLGRRAAATVPPFTAVTASAVVGAVALAPWVAATGGFAQLGAVPGPAWLAVAYLALPGTVGNWSAYYWAVSRVGAAAAAPFANLVPVWTLAVAVPLLHEVPSPGQVAGALLTVGGVWLTRGRQASAPAAAEPSG